MSKNVVSVVLAVYFLAALAAVLVRFDEFPFTWVPMYSAYAASDFVEVPLRDRKDMNAGLLVARRDGATDRVTARMLNLPSRNYWRIHLQRMAGQGGGPSTLRPEWA